MYEIFILIFWLQSSCKLLFLLHGTVHWAGKRGEFVTWSCSWFVTSGCRVCTSTVCGFMEWEKSEQDRLFGQQQKLKNLHRPVLLCPGSILNAFHSNAEEAWVCSSDYVASNTLFICFNPMYYPECLMKAPRWLQLHWNHHAALLLQGELTDRISPHFLP